MQQHKMGTRWLDDRCRTRGPDAPVPIEEIIKMLDESQLSLALRPHIHRVVTDRLTKNLRSLDVAGNYSPSMHIETYALLLAIPLFNLMGAENLEYRSYVNWFKKAIERHAEEDNFVRSLPIG